MPFPGTVWRTGTWDEDAWAANTWEEAVAVVEPPALDIVPFTFTVTQAYTAALTLTQTPALRFQFTQGVDTSRKV